MLPYICSHSEETSTLPNYLTISRCAKIWLFPTTLCTISKFSSLPSPPIKACILAMISSFSWNFLLALNALRCPTIS